MLRLPESCASVALLLFGLLVMTGGLGADTYYQAGKRAYSARKYEQAISYFQKAYRANPKSGNALYYIGRIYDDQRKIGRAVSYYKQAVHLRMESQLREQALWKVLLYLKHKKNWEELLEYSQLFLRYKSNRRVERMKELAEKNYDPVLARIRKEMEAADRLQRKGKFSEAREIYAGVLRQRSSYHQARWKLALLLMKEDKFSEALKHFQYLIRYDEDAWEYHYKSAVCLYRMRSYLDAEASLNKARARNKKPKKTFLYHSSYLRGLIAFETANFPRACSSLEQAYNLSVELARKPSAKLLSTLALSSIECGKLAKARVLLKEAVRKKAGTDLTLLARARYSLARRNHKQAFLLGKKILKKNKDKKSEELHPSYTPLFFFLGKRSAQKMHYYTAIAAFEKLRTSYLTQLAREARKSDPPRDLLWDFNYYYGISLMNTKQYTRAVHVLERLKKNAESYYLLARVYALQKDVTFARRMLLESVRLDSTRWERAQKDPPFVALMHEDPNFKEFIITRNKPREKQEDQKDPTQDEKKLPSQRKAHGS